MSDHQDPLAHLEHQVWMDPLDPLDPRDPLDPMDHQERTELQDQLVLPDLQDQVERREFARNIAPSTEECSSRTEPDDKFRIPLRFITIFIFLSSLNFPNISKFSLFEFKIA